MRLDATDLRYLPPDAFAVLKAIERGSLSHEVVPTSYIARAYASSSGAGLAKIISSLAKLRLIARVQGASYEGWRLSYGGYDWLAVKALSSMDVLHAVGQRVGVGKESDIYISVSPSYDVPLPLASTSVMAGSRPLPKLTLPESAPLVLKIHRLGRISFRKIKEKRDYLGKRRNDLGNWMFLSRLSAKREWEFLLLLHAHDFPVPTPIAYSRHAIIMSFIVDSHPLYQIRSLPTSQLGLLFSKLMQLIVRLAKHGLVHGDFNEFNILIRRRGNEDDEEDEGSVEDKTAWVRGEKQEAGNKEGARADLSLREGERIEEGKGFARIVAGETGADVAAGQGQESAEEDEEDEEEDDDDEDDEDDYDSDEDAEGQGEAAANVDLGEDEAMLEPILIDFPQMVSIEHPNAEEFFERDVECVRTFFLRRFRFETTSFPTFAETVGDLEQRRWKRRQREREERERRHGKASKGAAATSQTGEEERDADATPQLDVIGAASGVGGAKVEDELSRYIHGMRIGGEQSGGQQEDEVEEDDAHDDEDEEEALGEPVDAPGASQERDAERKAGTKARKPSSAKEGSSSALPSRGAALKALKDGDDSLVKQRLAAEMARKEASSRKHHGGKKSKGGKMGRAQAGSKAKMGDKAAVQGSLEF